MLAYLFRRAFRDSHISDRIAVVLHEAEMAPKMSPKEAIGGKSLQELVCWLL
jgi:hypothetical protein